MCADDDEGVQALVGEIGWPEAVEAAGGADEGSFLRWAGISKAIGRAAGLASTRTRGSSYGAVEPVARIKKRKRA